MKETFTGKADMVEESVLRIRIDIYRQLLCIMRARNSISILLSNSTLAVRYMYCYYRTFCISSRAEILMADTNEYRLGW